jgi:hypothetical protein
MDQVQCYKSLGVIFRWNLLEDGATWRRKGGVEPRIIISVSAWRSSLCVHGHFQCLLLLIYRTDPFRFHSLLIRLEFSSKQEWDVHSKTARLDMSSKQERDRSQQLIYTYIVWRGWRNRKWGYVTSLAGPQSSRDPYFLLRHPVVTCWVGHATIYIYMRKPIHRNATAGEVGRSVPISDRARKYYHRTYQRFYVQILTYFEQPFVSF